MTLLHFLSALAFIAIGTWVAHRLLSASKPRRGEFDADRVRRTKR